MSSKRKRYSRKKTQDIPLDGLIKKYVMDSTSVEERTFM